MKDTIAVINRFDYFGYKSKDSQPYFVFTGIRESVGQTIEIPRNVLWDEYTGEWGYISFLCPMPLSDVGFHLSFYYKDFRYWKSGISKNGLVIAEPCGEHKKVLLDSNTLVVADVRYSS